MADPMSHFSRRTRVAATELLDASYSQANFTRSMLKLGKVISDAVGQAGSVTTRANRLITLMDESPTLTADDGELIQNAVVLEAIGLLPPPENSPWGQPPTPSAKQSALMNSLALDGFIIENGELQRALPADLRLPETQDQLFALLDKHNLGTPKGHLQQALKAHTMGDWAAANSQMRSFIEGLLDDLAARLDPSTVPSPTGHGARAKLASLGFLYKDLNEWGDDGKGFINGLMNRLHPHGSHPGLSDEEDSTFRLHTVLIATRLLLVRFDNWP